MNVQEYVLQTHSKQQSACWNMGRAHVVNITRTLKDGWSMGQTLSPGDEAQAKRSVPFKEAAIRSSCRARLRST